MTQEDPTLSRLQLRASNDSRVWFPDVHASQWTAVVHFALGLAGEVGELVNLVKKANRKGGADPVAHLNMTDVGHEMADIAIYLMDLAQELGCDLGECIEAKRAVLIERWGDPCDDDR